MPYSNHEIIFREPTEEVREAVSTVIVQQMAEVLAGFRCGDLSDDRLCYERLYEAGFSSPTIFNLSSEARFQAWRIFEPHAASRDAYRNWLFHNRHVAVPTSVFVRQ